MGIIDSPENGQMGDGHSDLLRHFVEGTASPEDQEKLDSWVAGTPVSAHLVDTFVTGASLKNVPAPDAKAALKRVRARMVAESGVSATVSSTKLQMTAKIPPSGFSHRFFRYALTAGFALTLAFVAGWQLRSTQQASRPLNIVGSTYSTAAGQRATITLPDQSEVVLNVSSRLETSSDYAEGNRIVYLKGEAIFTVRHYNNAPFTVVSENGKTEVLGTKFLVRRYPTDSVTTVIVKDGKVRVAGNTTLTAGQQALFGGIDRVTVRQAEFANFSFADGVLVLPEMRISDAIIELNRWYDADIQLSSPALGSRTIGGEFTSGSIGDLISFLELALNVNVRRNGRVLTLFP